MFCLVEFCSDACDTPIRWQRETCILPCCFAAVTTDTLSSCSSSSVSGFVARRAAPVAAYL
jgi:hypothetical protein